MPARADGRGRKPRVKKVETPVVAVSAATDDLGTTLAKVVSDEQPAERSITANQPASATKLEDWVSAHPGVDTVLMFFPRPVIFTTDQRERILIGDGLQNVPEEWSAHWFLKNSGARRQPMNRA